MIPIPGEKYLVSGRGDLAYVQLGKHYYSIPKKNLVEL